jgi:hypothetical protein
MKTLSIFKKTIFSKNFKYYDSHFSLYNSKISKYNFFTARKNTTTEKQDKVKDNDKKPEKIKIYESKYNYFSEKLVIQGSLVMLLFSSYSFLFIPMSKIFYIANFIIFMPSLFIQYKLYRENFKFVKTINLSKDKKLLELECIKGKKDILPVEEIIVEDEEIKSVKEEYEKDFFLFTNKQKKKKPLYFVPKKGNFLDENSFKIMLERRVKNNK